MSDYPDQYDASLLEAVTRTDIRAELVQLATQPLFGWDEWRAYEFSWLNRVGMPQIAVLRVRIAADSACLPESKSFKHYLNSFAQTRLPSWDAVQRRINDDLSALAQGEVRSELLSLSEWARVGAPTATLPGYHLDSQQLACEHYRYDPQLLVCSTNAEVITETLHTHTLRTLCPLTGQPDWASVIIRYQGPAVCHQGLLRYIVGYRFFTGFHEQVVERIYQDIVHRLTPSALQVYACFQRRGGLDINPYRSMQPMPFEALRTLRQ